MNREAIANAIKDRLEAGEIGLPISWPNVGGGTETLARPRLEFQWADPTVSSPSLRGGYTREVGTFAITVIVDAGDDEGEANAYADQVAALFPKNLGPLIAGTTRIAFERAPTIRSGYRDGPDWRVPVIVTYAAIS